MRGSEEIYRRCKRGGCKGQRRCTGGVKGGCEGQRRCTGGVKGGVRLLVPTLELVEVLAARLGHRLSEVVTSDGLPIVAVEVQLHALAEVGVANQRAHHPDDLRALVARSESFSE